MAKTTLVCIKEIYEPAKETWMEYQSFTGEVTQGKPFMVPEYRVPVGSTCTARTQAEVKRMVSSGHWRVSNG